VVELLTKRGVAVHPGHFYDFPSTGYVILSLIIPEPKFGVGIENLMGLA
jgi:hypothetical protein